MLIIMIIILIIIIMIVITYEAAYLPENAHGYDG